MSLQDRVIGWCVAAYALAVVAVFAGRRLGWWP